MFEVYSYSEMNFKDWYYLVTYLTKVDHVSMNDIQLGVPSKYMDMFPKFRPHIHFLVEVGSYVYLIDNLSKEETYLKRKLVAFQESLCLDYGVVPYREELKKKKKQYIETFLLLEAATKEETCVIFVSGVGIFFLLSLIISQ